MTEAPPQIKVFDPFKVAQDPNLPTLALALNSVEIKEEFKRGLPRLAGPEGKVRVKSVRVTRYKPGKRCVMEYEVRVVRPNLPREKTTLIGKIRARRYGNESYRLLETFWNAGFQADSPDGISVPEPIGVLPKFQMWLQRKVPGAVAMDLLGSPDGPRLARRIAEAIYKVHQAAVPTERAHTMADELCILHEHLPLVSKEKPEWTERIERVLIACDRLGASVPAPKTCGIHRDFYPAQVLVDEARLYLIDFDLYCQGDPGLDVGNFLGHVIEQSLRTYGNPRALADFEGALLERFVELSGPAARAAVAVYTTLTLVRHIYLSSQFPERQPWTEAVLELCEKRLEG